METVRIYRLNGLAPATQEQLKAAQMEARMKHLPWPTQDVLQKATKGGRFVQTSFINEAVSVTANRLGNC